MSIEIAGTPHLRVLDVPVPVAIVLIIVVKTYRPIARPKKKQLQFKLAFLYILGCQTVP